MLWYWAETLSTGASPVDKISVQYKYIMFSSQLNRVLVSAQWTEFLPFIKTLCFRPVQNVCAQYQTIAFSAQQTKFPNQCTKFPSEKFSVASHWKKKGDPELNKIVFEDMMSKKIPALRAEIYTIKTLSVIHTRISISKTFPASTKALCFPPMDKVSAQYQSIIFFAQ